MSGREKSDKKQSIKKNEHKGVGHRRRLRERFLQSGLEGFLDYEIVELLLTLGTPRKDCKARAKKAIKKFKGLRGVLDANPKDLQEIEGIGPMNAFGIKLFQAMAERYAKEKIPKKITLDSTKAVAKYLQEKIGKEKKEHFVVLCLNARNQLIHKETISVGILNANLVHPREVFKPAIDHLAVSIIVAHNHPSGETKAGEADIMLTRRLIEAGKILGIDVSDHVIVTKDQWRSVKNDIIF